jgi:hypothetical protein
VQNGRAGELEFTIVIRRQQRPRDAARIPVGAEENKLAFDHVLGLEPCGERPSVRWGVDILRRRLSITSEWAAHDVTP